MSAFTPKTCPTCRHPFTPSGPRQQYCYFCGPPRHRLSTPVTRVCKNPDCRTTFVTSNWARRRCTPDCGRSAPRPKPPPREPAAAPDDGPWTAAEVVLFCACMADARRESGPTSLAAVLSQAKLDALLRAVREMAAGLAAAETEVPS